VLLAGGGGLIEVAGRTHGTRVLWLQEVAPYRAHKLLCLCGKIVTFVQISNENFISSVLSQLYFPCLL